MRRKVKPLLLCLALICAPPFYAESTEKGVGPVANKNSTSAIEFIEPDIKVAEAPASQEAKPNSELSNQELIAKLNVINEMSSSEQRQLLIEIQRRILKEGPEPFIQGRNKAIQVSEESEGPVLEDEPIKIVTTEIRPNAAEEFVRESVKGNTKKSGDSAKKPVPYGSAYSE